MKKGMSELTQRQRDQIRALEALPDDQIDLSEAPEVLDWSNAVRGKYYRRGEDHVGRPVQTTTDTSEKGLERLICTAMTGAAPADGRGLAEAPAAYGGPGWVEGAPQDYDREHAVDLVQLTAFLRATQPEVAEALALAEDGPTRRSFLARLQGEVTKRGTIDVLRSGVRHRQYQLDLFYGTPSPGNPAAAARYACNRFTITRQLRYSRDETQLALDLVSFINGLPVFSFELKNNLTKQTVADAVQQYQRDRSPRELLFQFGRCVAHFAVDDQEVRFCTHLTGKDSWFLPFNQGWRDGAGNPPNPEGIKTDYLWQRILTPRGLTDILEHYAQVVAQRDDKTGKRKRVQIFPRYHQLDVVRALLAHAAAHGAGQRYLVQHSAGSGKSNSIAWLAHQLVGSNTPAGARSTRSSWSPTAASSTSRSATPSSSSPRSARRWATPSARATCAASSRTARRSSSRPSRSSPTCSRTSARRTPAATSRSSSTRRTPVRAARRRGR